MSCWLILPLLLAGAAVSMFGYLGGITFSMPRMIAFGVCVAIGSLLYVARSKR